MQILSGQRNNEEQMEFIRVEFEITKTSIEGLLS